LASIRSSAELCADDRSCAACQSSRDIIDQVDHLERWVRNLLTYSHPDKGGPTTVDLPPLIERAEAQFQRECARRNIALSVDLPQALPAVAAYEPLLEQVLCSLIANAVEAMPGGGELKVSVNLAERETRS
jgi:signal transduction histidine kinase